MNIISSLACLTPHNQLSSCFNLLHASPDIAQELERNVGQLKCSLDAAKEDLEITLNIIAKTEKKIELAEVGIKTTRTKMVNTQVNMFLKDQIKG